MIVNFTDSTNLDYSALKKENRNFKLALTSGCFDLLHPGHIFFLNECKKSLPFDTKLLIATHTDRDIANHKGNDRPVFKEEERLILLDNLKATDFVGIWPKWNTIYELAFELKPDFLCTSANIIDQPQWANSWSVVANKIQAQLILIPRATNSISTTKILAGILAKP